MKTVFRSNEIAHVWFHAQAPHGKCSGSMSFQGDVFLSYNTAIARKVNHKGQVAVILNDESFSVISWEEIDRFATLMEWNKETVAA